MFWMQLVVVLSYFRLIFLSGLNAGRVFFVDLGSASNQTMSLHELTTATVTATKTIDNIREKNRFYMTSTEICY